MRHCQFGSARRRTAAKRKVEIPFAWPSRRGAVNRSNHMRNEADPWTAFVTVAQIPEGGLHKDIEANAGQRAAMAETAGLREVLSASASFDVTPGSGGRFHVAGWVRARIGQNCVVTLEPMESDIDETIDLVFAP